MAITNQQIFDFLVANPSISDRELAAVMDAYGVSPQQVAQATGTSETAAQQRYEAVAAPVTQSVYEPPAPVYQAPPVDYFSQQFAPDVYETPAVISSSLPVTQPVTNQQIVDFLATKPVTLPSNTNTTSVALNYALNNGISQDQYYKNIFNYVNKNRGLNDVQLRAEMDRLGVSAADVAAATGVPLAGVQTRYNVADEGAGRYIAPANIPASVGLTWGLNNNMTQAQIDQNIFNFVNNNRGLSDIQLATEMDRLGISPNDVARATGVSYESVAGRYNAAKTGNVGGTGNTAITDIFTQYVTPTGTVTPVTPTPVPPTVVPPVVVPPKVVTPTVVTPAVVPPTFTPTATVGVGPNTINQPAITAGQMRELFPSFAESKRLAGEMVANRPTTQNIMNMIQGANISPTYRPPPVNTMPTGLMDAWTAAEASGNYGNVANMLKGLNANDLRNFGASAADIAYITSRPQIAGMFPTAPPAAAPSLNNVLSMISK